MNKSIKNVCKSFERGRIWPFTYVTKKITKYLNNYDTFDKLS